MDRRRDKYLVAGVDLSDVRNRNETRVAEAMRLVLEECGNLKLDTEALQDVYACALNQLSARYVQSGTIILRDPVEPQEIREAVEGALQQVMNIT